MSTREGIRVGFILSHGDWLGGRNYLRNLFSAIRMVPRNPIVPVIFTGRRQNDAVVDFPGIEVVQTAVLDHKSPAWLVRKVVAKSSARDFLLQKVLQQQGISVLSHSFHLGSQTAVKTIGWIPDFQHVHLPDFFTNEERIQRDREFEQVCGYCDKIILSSECAREDFRAFSPEHANKAQLLRFVASPIPLDLAVGLSELQCLYSFHGPYFLLPNQFWVHKNHRVVLRALQILKGRGKPFLVLATGSTTDYRNPSFYPGLIKYASECNVLDCFRVLGKIPFDHLIGLMQHAVAFINPSRFEGWSTSVEEAKSLGKKIILSDIPVHREQAPHRGFFFPADDPEALVAAMEAVYTEHDQQEDAAKQTAAIALFPKRQQEFGEAYLQIVL